ncbi:MAG: hypothetical protein ABL912_02895 [Novosphingobium sp.]
MIQDNPANWSHGFQGSEHPETARLRVEKDYIERMVSLKRETMDRTYAYLCGLLDKAKEELGHARSGGSSGDHRRQALRQHVDEIAAYLQGNDLKVDLPPTYSAETHPALKTHYILEEVPQFFGKVQCVLDQWYDSHLIALYDEMVVLTRLKPKSAANPMRQPAQ